MKTSSELHEVNAILTMSSSLEDVKTLTSNYKYMNNKQNIRAMRVPFGIFLSLVLFTLFVAKADALSVITSSLDMGSQNADVTTLQTYLATDSSIYPSGLVTGYFGQLTKAAVERFQAREGIVSAGTPATTGYGRVGPATLAALNQKINGGVVIIPVSGDASPYIYPVNVSVTNTNATLNWNTNEGVSAVLYYSTSPLPMTEGSATSRVFIGGSSMLVHTDLRTAHTATLNNLSSNTVYYYVVYVRDQIGNESITWPATFITTQ